MKAEDTVMNIIEQAKIWLNAEQKAGFLLDCDIKGVLTDSNLFGAEAEQLHSQAIAKAQAEISFPAGEKQGYEKGFKAGEKEMFRKIRQALKGEPVVFDYALDPYEIEWLYEQTRKLFAPS